MNANIDTFQLRYLTSPYLQRIFNQSATIKLLISIAVLFSTKNSTVCI